jgi:hypothetical protein
MLMAIALFAQPGIAQPINLISWNIEGNGEADAAFLREIVTRIDAIDIWGFCEVRSGFQADLDAAAEADESIDYTVVSDFSGGDRLGLVLLINEERFEILNSSTLNASEFSGSRLPLIAELRDRRSGLVFGVVLSHLTRGSGQSGESRRQAQAAFLNNWAGAPGRLAIGMGDYNVDFDVPTGLPEAPAGDFDALFAGDRWVWVRPSPLRATYINDPTEIFHSILDFILLSQSLSSQTTATSAVLADFYSGPDTTEIPDHFPVFARVTPGSGPADSLEAIATDLRDGLRRLQAIGVDAALVSRLQAVVEQVEGLTRPDPGSARLRIAALLPNPVGNEEMNESATIENAGGTTADLTGHGIRDAAGQTWNLSGILGPGESRTFARNGQPMALNNGGDVVELVSGGDDVLDRFEYSSTVEGVELRR